VLPDMVENDILKSKGGAQTDNDGSATVWNGLKIEGD
jgi:hypothetical protein